MVFGVMVEPSTWIWEIGQAKLALWMSTLVKKVDICQWEEFMETNYMGPMPGRFLIGLKPVSCQKFENFIHAKHKDNFMREMRLTSQQSDS